MELSDRVRFSLVGRDLQEFDRVTIGPDRLAVRQRTDRFSYFAPRPDIAQWPAREPRLKLAHNGRIKGRRLNVEPFIKSPRPKLPDEGIVSKQSTFLVLDAM